MAETAKDVVIEFWLLLSMRHLKEILSLQFIPFQDVLNLASLLVRDTISESLSNFLQKSQTHFPL